MKNVSGAAGAAARRGRTAHAGDDARSRMPGRSGRGCSRRGSAASRCARLGSALLSPALVDFGACLPGEIGRRRDDLSAATAAGCGEMPPAGIEPAHIGLKVRCSTAELRRPGAFDSSAQYACARVSVGGVQTGGRRRRRTPAVAEAEIVGAAESFLHERSFRELTVDEVMRRTDLSRPSFYVYFRDRHHLMLRVVEHIGDELRTMSQRWYTGAGDGPAQAREAMEGIVEVFGEHGPVLRGLADAAADDPEIERVYGALVQSFVDATVRHIEAEA